MTKFDFLASLLDFGLGHVVEDVLELLDVEDLLSVQLVSKLWSVEERKKPFLYNVLIFAACISAQTHLYLSTLSSKSSNLAEYGTGPKLVVQRLALSLHDLINS